MTISNEVYYLGFCSLVSTVIFYLCSVNKNIDIYHQGNFKIGKNKSWNITILLNFTQKNEIKGLWDLQGLELILSILWLWWELLIYSFYSKCN